MPKKQYDENSPEVVYTVAKAAYYWHHLVGLCYTYLLLSVLIGMFTSSSISFLGILILLFAPALINSKLDDISRNLAIQQQQKEEIAKKD